MKMRLIGLILSVVMVASMVAGCSSSNTSNSASSSTPKETASAPASETPKPAGGGKVTVQFWHSLGGANNEYLDKVIKNFNDSHPEIEVVGTYQGGYDGTVTKLQQAIAGNNGPDMTMLERAYVQQFADADVLEDLTPYMEKSGLSKDAFVEGLMGHSFFNDKFVSLPFNRSTPILYVNKDLLDELGMEVPQTWEDLKKVANAMVVKEGGKIERYGLSMPYDTWYPMAMMTQAGGKFFTDDGKDVGFVDNGVGEKVFGFLKDLQKNGALFYPPQQQSSSIVGQMFTSGQLGMVFQSTGVMGGYEEAANFNMQAAFLPKEQVHAQPTGGANISMLSSSKNKDAVWEFMHWLMTDPNGGQQFILDSGYLPFTKAMGESKEIQDLWAKDPNRKVAFDQLQYAIDTNKSVVWNEVLTEFNAAMQAIFYDDADIKSQLETFKKKAQNILSSQ